MGLETVTIYIKGNQNVEVKSQKVSLGDVLEIECVNKAILAKLKTIRLLSSSKSGEERRALFRIWKHRFKHFFVLFVC